MPVMLIFDKNHAPYFIVRFKDLTRGIDHDIARKHQRYHHAREYRPLGQRYYRYDRR